MSLLDTDILQTKHMLVEERVVPGRVVASDHERLASILRTELGDVGTLLPMGDVLGWTTNDRNIETHAQIAPDEAGTRIRLVIRGVSASRPKHAFYLGLGVGLAGVLAAVMIPLGVHGARLALYVIAPLVLMGGAGVYDRWSYDRRAGKLYTAAEALVKALAQSQRVPHARVEDVDEDASAQPRRGTLRR